MIFIADKEMRPADLEAKFEGVEREILDMLLASPHQYHYATMEQLAFELQLRKEIILASYELYRSDLGFAIFRKTKCNPEYWNRTPSGGFVLKNNVKPSNAILDIFTNGSKYATECATAMMIIYYRALLNVYSESLFNKIFPSIELMNWHHIDRLLREVGMMTRREDYLPGDRRYFNNPDVNPQTPQWQGENVIDLGNGLYYGHGIGMHKASVFIEELNRNRANNSDVPASLMDSAGRPDFNKLEAQMHR